MTVVLKPNLVMTSKPEEAIITHPALVAAVGEVCAACRREGFDCGKSRRALYAYDDEGGASGDAVIRIWPRHAVFSLYTDCESREVPLPGGVRCRRMAIVSPFLGADYLIDLAKLKTHSMVGFSGAVKNMFGAVPGLKKAGAALPVSGKAGVFGDVAGLVRFFAAGSLHHRRDLGHGSNGPTGGTRRDLGVLAASKSPYAVDVCCAKLAGLEAGQVLMLRYAAERGLVPQSIDGLELLGDSLESLSVPDFQKAEASSTDFIDRLPRFLRPAAKSLRRRIRALRKKSCVGCGKCAKLSPEHDRNKGP